MRLDKFKKKREKILQISNPSKFRLLTIFIRIVIKIVKFTSYDILHRIFVYTDVDTINILYSNRDIRRYACTYMYIYLKNTHKRV